MVAPATRDPGEPRCGNWVMCPNQSPARWRAAPAPVASASCADDRQFDLRRYGAGPVRELEPLGLYRCSRRIVTIAAREDSVLRAVSRRPSIIMVGSPERPKRARAAAPRPGIPIVETWEMPEAPIDAVAGVSTITKPVARSRAISRAGRQSLGSSGRRSARTRSCEWLQRHRAAGAPRRRRWTIDRKHSGRLARWRIMPGVDGCSPQDAHASGFMAGLRAAGLLRNGKARSSVPSSSRNLEMGR